MATTPTALLRKLEDLEEAVASLTEIVVRSSDEVLDTKAAARMLGITPRTLHNKCSSRVAPCPFPFYKDEAGHLRFLRSDLFAYLTKQRIAPRHEIDQLAADR